MKSRSKISGIKDTDPEAGGSDLKRLSLIEPGGAGTVVRIDDQLSSQVTAMGIRVGCHIVLDNKQPLSGPIVVKVGNMVTSIGCRMAQGIEVAVDP
jgi:Fe2+ transport system protein FeoA